MLRKKQQSHATAQKRRVIVAIKTSGYEAKEGHRITEIACVEMRGMEKTGNNFHAFVNPGEELINLCREVYKADARLTPVTTKAAENTISAMLHAPKFTPAHARAITAHGVPAYLCSSVTAAPPFAKVENSFLKYLMSDPDTVIVTHDMGRLKSFLEHQLPKKKWEMFLKKFHDPKHGMMSKVHKFRGAGLFPEPAGKSWTSGLSLDAICNHFGVDVSNRTYFSAMQDALLLSEVLSSRKEIKMNNIMMFPESKSYPELSNEEAAEDSSPETMHLSM